MTDAPKKKRKYLRQRLKRSTKPTHYIMLGGAMDRSGKMAASEIPRFGIGLRGVVLVGTRGKWVSLYYPAMGLRARIGVDVWKRLTGRNARWWPGEYRTERGRAQLARVEVTCKSET